jgi:Tol biopolymer transport system component
LQPGTRLGAYEIVSLIGVGGMGEVFRARDTRLNRDVAIKILPAAVAGDRDRIARFAREAQTLALLNHPSIAQIYGIEDSNQAQALVMELVAGEDLAKRLERGPLPLDETLPIARQIADALEAAHDHGIIHRDLKPANIKVRPDGTVKVLDFGLAKSAASASGVHDAASALNSPTLSLHATQAGIILGTAAYMSPEQARGRTVDRRTDIWAFGAVLFEMLTGKRAFPGDDITDTIVSVVSKEPEWDALPAVPPALRRLLTRCLKKDPRARLRDIGEARVQIEELLSGDAPGVPAAAPRIPTPDATSRPALPRVLMWSWAAATFTLIGAVIWLWSANADTPLPRRTMRLTPFAFEQGGQISPVWSPDGKGVAFAARQSLSEQYQIYVRYLGSPAATRMTNFSAGAVPIEWTTTGKIVFVSRDPSNVWSVSQVGGDPEPLTIPGAEYPDLQRPTMVAMSRDGSVFAWLHGTHAEYTVGFSSPPGAPALLYEPAPFAKPNYSNSPLLKFSPDGKKLLLFLNSGSGEEVWLLPYPPDPSNPPKRILQEIRAYQGTPTASWLPDSRHIVLAASDDASPWQLYYADTVTSRFTGLFSGTTDQRSPTVSPDGTKLVFRETTNDYDIVSMDVATGQLTSLVATQRIEDMPAWAANADAMTYVTDRNGGSEIWLLRPGQLDRPIVTARDVADGAKFMVPSLSPDGTRVIYTRLIRDGASQLWMSAVAGGSPVRLVAAASDFEFSGGWSPDGNEFVYLHIVKSDTFVAKVKTTGNAKPETIKAVNRTSGASVIPVWSPSGEWILMDDNGPKLISPDGKSERPLAAAKDGTAFGFSADGKTIYGLSQPTKGKIEFFSLPITGEPRKRIAILDAQYSPSNTMGPSLRLSLTSDGKALTYATLKPTSNIWLMDGLHEIKLR